MDNQTFHFGDRGVYTLVVLPAAKTLFVYRDQMGDADHGPDCWPVLYAIIILAALAVAYGGAKYVYNVKFAKYPSQMFVINQTSDERRGTSDESTALIYSMEK